MDINDLKEYNEAEAKLYNELDGLSFDDASERLRQLWSLVPYNYEINPVRLMKKFNLLFKGHPDLEKHTKKYIIDVG